MEGSPKKKALLALRKQIQALIADQEMDDPEAAESDQVDATEAMAGMGDEEDDAKPETTAAQSKFLDYMKPRVKPRRPGTGLMTLGAETKTKMPEKRGPGRPRKEAV